MQFKPGQNAVQCQMTFDVPLSALKFSPDPKTAKARMHASLVALIHDSNGEIVDKISRDLVREAPTQDVGKVQHESVLYSEPLVLSPGHYTVDTAVVDEQADKASAKRSSVFVTSGHDIRLSSLEIVKRMDPIDGPRNALNPFELENARITPSLSDTVPSGKPVHLYFVVYPEQDQGDQNRGDQKPRITLQMFQNGKEIARTSPELPKPDFDGSIPVVAELSPGPGQYDLRVTVQQGSSTAQSSVTLTVE